MADTSADTTKANGDSPLSESELHAALELRASAELQLASYCERLIVFGAGGVGAGVTVAAGIVARLGRVEAYTALMTSIVCMGLSTTGAILVDFDCSTSSYIDLRTTASSKIDPQEIERMVEKRKSSRFQRWIRFSGRLGSLSNSLRGAAWRLYVTLGLAMLLFNGFMQYVIFVIANIRKFSH